MMTTLYNRRLAAMQVGQAHTTEGPTIGSYGSEDPMRIQRETKGRVRGIYIPEAVQGYLVLHMNKPPFQIRGPAGGIPGRRPA